MSLLIFLPIVLLIIPFIPTFIEIFKRKDKGPREIPEQTTYEEPPDLDISRLERARGDARARAPGDVIRITGNVSIPEGTEINNHLMVQGNLKIGRKSHIHGSIKAFGDVEIGESSTVEGHVLSEGRVTIGRNCLVKGIVDSLKDITLEENAVVEAVSTEKTVRVGPNAKIKRRILSGASIVTFPQLKHTEQVTEPEVTTSAPKLSVEKEQSQELIEGLKPLPPPPIEEKPTVKGGKVPFEVLDPEVGHLYLYAPTRYGKTYLIRNYIIPQLSGKKKIVVIDGHREYPFESYNVNYDKTIPNVENDLFKTFITFNIWGDIEGLIEDMINHVAQAKGNLSIRPNILDSNVERLVISEFLKRITQIKWKTPILLIVEDADKYDVVSAVTRGRHANIQVILTSAKRLMPEVFSNAHLVLGSINPVLIRDYDSYAAETIVTLGRYEFIWEKDYHDWRRFRLGQEPKRKFPSEPRTTEEKELGSKTPFVPMLKIPKPKETRVKPKSVTESIFEYLEERIKMLDEAKTSPIEFENIEGLTPLEEKVLKAAYTCHSREEICLKLLMDPSEVDDIINSLIEKGYLDKDLKPKVPTARRRSPIKKADIEQIKQPVSQASKPEGKASLKELEEEPLLENELIERLIASKIRGELKRKIEKTEESSTAKRKGDSNKVNVIQKTGSRDVDSVLREWRKASSLLWGKERETDNSQSISKHSADVDESSAEKAPESRERNSKEE